MEIIKKIFNTEEKKYSINIFMFLLGAYAVFILLNDYLCLITRSNYAIPFYIVSAILVIIMSIFVLKKVKISVDSFNKEDIIFVIFVGFIYFVKIVFPDKAFDTLNYHLFVQERFFANNTTFNFFPGRWINTFSYPMADRMHYFFRLILGYRLGIFFNSFILLTIFYQSKRLIKIFIKDINPLLNVIFSTFVICTEMILQNAITYYVDLFAIPFIMEILIIIFEDKLDANKHLWVLFCAGITLTIKISNAFLLIPLAFYYIIKARKTINVKTVIGGIIIVALIIFPYAFNTYIQTKNPVFPFYNSIFKSPYLENENWSEKFYGPKTIKERITWPFFVYNNGRRANDNNIYTGRISIGYAAALILIIDSLIKKDKKKALLGLCTVILLLIWSNFMMGYIRYALILEVLSGITIFVLLNTFYKDKKFLKNIIIVVISLYIFQQISTSVNSIVYSYVELSWRQTYYTDEISYKSNLKGEFKKDSYDEYLEGVDCFAIADYNSGYAVALSNDIPIIGIVESYNNSYGENEFNTIIDSYKDKNIYLLSTTQTLDRTIKYLNKTNFKISGDIRYFYADFLDVSTQMILLKIEKSDNKNANDYVIIESENDSLNVPIDKQSKTISFYYGNNPALSYSTLFGYELYLDFMDENNNLIEHRFIDKIKSNEILKHIEIDIPKKTKEVRVNFKNLKEENMLDGNIMILNFAQM